MAYPYPPYGSPYYDRVYYPPPALSPPVHRARSHSHGRPVDVNFYNNTSDRGRGVDRIAEELAYLRLAQEHRSHSRRRSRSHSRSRSRRRSRSRSRSVESMKRQIERMKHDMDEEHHRAHAADHDKEVITRWENEQAEKKRKEEKLIADTKAKIEVEKVLKKEKEEKEWKEFELKQAQKKLDEEIKKKEEKKKVDEGVRETFRKMGYSELQIDRHMEAADKKHHERDHGITSNTTTTLVSYQPQSPGYVIPGHHHHGGEMVVAGGHKPTFARVKIGDIDPEILNRFGIPFKYDIDPGHILILSEINQTFFEVLHDETRKYRKKHSGLAIEGKKKHSGSLKGMKLVAHRSRSRSKSHSREGDHVHYRLI